MTDCKNGCEKPVRGEAFDVCWTCWKKAKTKANLEKVREANRRWYRANSEKVKEANKKWQKANPEKAREAVRKWQRANPEKVREANRKWQRANPEKHREYRRKYYHNVIKPRRDCTKRMDRDGKRKKEGD